MVFLKASIDARISLVLIPNALLNLRVLSNVSEYCLTNRSCASFSFFAPSIADCASEPNSLARSSSLMPIDAAAVLARSTLLTKSVPNESFNVLLRYPLPYFRPRLRLLKFSAASWLLAPNALNPP